MGLAAPDTRAQARLDLARFYMARGMYYEAKGVADFVLSEAKPEDAWAGRTGLVHHAVMHDHPNLMEWQVYACGAPIMVESAERDFIARCGLPDDEFYADAFTSEADKHGG